MGPERWEKVNELFHAALEIEPSQRSAFLRRMCKNDKKLLNEVEKLVAAHEQSDDFIQNPVVPEAVELLSSQAEPASLIGKTFGVYQIVKEIGRGGMGVVFLAQDTKLERMVAIKVLNEGLSRRESNLQRFIREAKAASALSHPNILVIHEIRESEAGHYIVSEFIEGKTLREIIKEGPLNLDDVLDISIQIVNALAVAHAAYIIHRDIKPENIIVRPDGLVKILDFGLAKLTNPEQISPASLSLKQNETTAGIILGTVNYMSPEQTKGEMLDARTDIFSFGVVLYEMIAGRTPFQAESVLETLANLINSEPAPLSRFVANVPDELQQIVDKTLRKNRDERYQITKDLLTDLRTFQKRREFEFELKKTALPDKQNGTQEIKTITGRNVRKLLPNKLTENRLLVFVGPALLILLGLIVLGLFTFYRPGDSGKLNSNINSNSSFTTAPRASNTNSIESDLKKAGEISASKLPSGVEMNFAYIPAGEFQMGSDLYNEEKPVHIVKISQGFWMQQTEVTQEQWSAIMGKLPSNCEHGKFAGELDAKRPVFCVSWDDTQKFIAKLNALNDGFRYRLPTEAEWEYAARAGTVGDNPKDLNLVAWYQANSGGHPHDVGTKLANAWNLYDMQGNVWEWCEDWYEGYSGETLTDPTGPETGTSRVGRGFGWNDSSPYRLRLTTRGDGPPSYRDGFLGFRVVRQSK